MANNEFKDLNKNIVKDSEQVFNDKEKFNDTNIESKVESESEEFQNFEKANQKSEEEIRQKSEQSQKSEEETHHKSEKEIHHESEEEIQEFEEEVYKAYLYFYGFGVKEDLEKAFILYNEAAENNYGLGQYFVGKCFEEASEKDPDFVAKTSRNGKE
ncbi:13421_t:CDS:2 [Gigaspora rosea]|nr:13421_t:CDS:2 [Gigaspora rosea]